MPKGSLLAEPGQTTTQIIYHFAAPPELVYRAWTDPDLIHLWWGAARYVAVVDTMQVRPGGRWRFVQKDGRRDVAAFHGVYRVVQPPERLEYTFIYEGEPEQVVLERLSFAANEGGTRLINDSEFASLAVRDAQVAAGMEAGAVETLQRLDGLLADYAGRDLPPGLSAPARRALYEAGLWRLEQAAALSDGELKRLHGLGARGIKILRGV